MAILGSTGSIGEQTLDVARRFADEFEVRVLTAHRNWKRLAEQAIEFDADCVVIADERYYRELSEALSSTDIKAYAGAESVCQVAASSEVDVVVNALVGYAGMMPSYEAVRAGKKLALANKESLVVAGNIIMAEAMERRVPILPIDSEHSAIFQCLAGEVSDPERLIITASGGPFRKTAAEELDNVTVEQALKHPSWSMGSKITIDSATMFNKGFEVIEAHWLFGMPPEKIEVVVHPQSVVHSMVEFADGAVKAQLGVPDMREPIQYALRYPLRGDFGGEKLDLCSYGALTFEAPDRVKFPALDIVYGVIREGGNAGCVMNAANEVAVAAFLERRIRFTDIARVVGNALEHREHIAKPTMEQYVESDKITRGLSEEFVKKRAAYFAVQG